MDFNPYARVRPAVSPLACVALLALGWLAIAPLARADNPGYDRPGIGFTPAVLGGGQVTFEQGLPDWSRDHRDGSSASQYSADTLLRIGVGGPLELQLGGSLYNDLRVTETQGRYASHGQGDSSIGLKLALPSPQPAFSWGLLGSVELTNGAKDFRGDRRQYLLAAQLNFQLDARNALGAYMQDIHTGGRDSTELAFSDNLILAPTLVSYAEVARLQMAQRGAGSLVGAGFAWLVTPRVQLDAGFDHRLGGLAPQWQANLGASVYFGR
jgi:hypothetical protein